jgi:hypothetical protein
MRSLLKTPVCQNLHNSTRINIKYANIAISSACHIHLSVGIVVTLAVAN